MDYGGGKILSEVNVEGGAGERKNGSEAEKKGEGIKGGRKNGDKEKGAS